jgi:ceramide glucosyltransferase
MSLALWAAGYCIVMTLIQLVSVAIAAVKCRRRSRHMRPPDNAPPVTVLRPVCGIDNCADETLGSTFRLDYPAYEIIFCVARADDPVVAIVERLIDANPRVAARLLIGDDRISSNPKLNNVVKGWAAARHDWIVTADSNVLMPSDYIQRLLARWHSDTGLVCSTPIGARPGNFWAELECAFLNTLQARWQYVGASFGLGFAQGKTMLFRRELIERGGGIGALGADLAEDAAATKLVRGQGLNVHLVDNPFEQPLGRRSAAEVWSRQLRWARLRRVSFPRFFLAELISGSVLPIIAGTYAAARLDVGAGMVLAILLVIWLGAEAALARAAGWHFSPRMPLTVLLRDLLLPVLWIEAWLSDDFIWRGNAMNLRATSSEETSESAGP